VKRLETRKCVSKYIIIIIVSDNVLMEDGSVMDEAKPSFSCG
jgi:hypothetical protein